MSANNFSRRDFLQTGTAAAMGVAVGCSTLPEKPIVSIVKIKDNNIEYAVNEAIELIGGIKKVTKGKNSILLKPNLVIEAPACTTKPAVIQALAKLMQNAGKEVVIGEGSAVVNGFNNIDGVTYRTQRTDILNPMQQFIFDELGYANLAQSLHVPLINLHSGELVEVDLPNGYVNNKITLHKSLMDVDMLCSVPMMKTHVFATVTLGMKNLIGLYPGTVYYSARSWLHDRAADKGSPGIAFEIVDMVRANKVGLVVIDASTAMEGNGPAAGTLVNMNLIIAGTNPLATDMVAAQVMGFHSTEVPTFVWAIKAGMQPSDVSQVEIRGQSIKSVQRQFIKPNIVPWDGTWASQVI